MTFKDPCTIALELDKELMQIHTNPYVENLVEMGYDRADCETVAVGGVDKTPDEHSWESVSNSRGVR